MNGHCNDDEPTTPRGEELQMGDCVRFLQDSGTELVPGVIRVHAVKGECGVVCDVVDHRIIVELIDTSAYTYAMVDATTADVELVG
ncbi:MAG: hypothetical protein K2W85_07665 [Phycisphaerales bacterium]|nr:hypothetical protein [Phycisphaerales bacterium]